MDLERWKKKLERLKDIVEDESEEDWKMKGGEGGGI